MAIGKPVVLGPEKIPGVIGLKAIHLVSREEGKKVPKTDSMYLDIGAADKDEALALEGRRDTGETTNRVFALQALYRQTRAGASV